MDIARRDFLLTAAGAAAAALGAPAAAGAPERQAIARGRPLLAAFGDATETTPVGGHGLLPTERRP